MDGLLSANDRLVAVSSACTIHGPLPRRRLSRFPEALAAQWRAHACGGHRLQFMGRPATTQSDGRSLLRLGRTLRRRRGPQGTRGALRFARGGLARIRGGLRGANRDDRHRHAFHLRKRGREAVSLWSSRWYQRSLRKISFPAKKPGCTSSRSGDRGSRPHRPPRCPSSHSRASADAARLDVLLKIAAHLGLGVPASSAPLKFPGRALQPTRR